VQQLFLQDLIVAQVVQAQEGVRRGEERYRIYRAGLFDDAGNPVGAVYRSLRLNFTRIKGGQGLPLEVLDSTRRLSDVLQGYADAVSDYDRGRYRLLLALGLSPQALLDPSCMPLPPAPGPVVAAAPLPAPAPAAPATPPPAEMTAGPRIEIVRPEAAPPPASATPTTLDELRGAALPPIGSSTTPSRLPQRTGLFSPPR
jgi:hypothetical protein